MRLCHGRNFNKNLLSRGILFTCLIVEMMIQVKSQHFGHGRCPRTSRAPPVNIRRYIARPWYYIYSFDNILEVGNICSREDLSLKSNGNINKVTTAIRNFKETNIEGSAVINRSGNGGLLTIKLRNGLLPGGNLLTRRNEILNETFYYSNLLIPLCDLGDRLWWLFGSLFMCSIYVRHKYPILLDFVTKANSFKRFHSESKIRIIEIWNFYFELLQSLQGSTSN